MFLKEFSMFACLQQLKRKEKEIEVEMQKLSRDKILAQERIAGLRRELMQMGIKPDWSQMMADMEEEGTHSDSTDTGASRHWSAYLTH